MKKKAISIAFAIFLLVLLCSYIVWPKINKFSIEVNTTSIEASNVVEEESEESPEISKEEILTKSKSNLVNKLDILGEYFKIKGTDKTVNDFVEWLSLNYSVDIINELGSNNDSSANINRDFYSQTGKSLFVLSDEYLENQDNIYKEGKKIDSADILFAGDVCLAEDGFVLDYYDTTASLKDCISDEIIKRTNDADIFMLNNEFTFGDRGTALEGKMYTFRAKAERVSILNELGTDIVSIANNHVYDFRVEGFMDTTSTIKNAGISYVGGGSNKEESEKVVYYIVNGIKIGFVSASRAEKVRYTKGADENNPGIFLMYDDTRLNEVIAEADKQCDYLIAYLHWGTEDSKYYEQYQHDIAEKLINSGADAIIGGHPHILQGMEFINGKPVVYSLGDFWFNNETKYNGMINLEIGIDGLKNITYLPCIQTNYTTVYVNDENTKKEMFEYLRELSPGCEFSEDGVVTPAN